MIEDDWFVIKDKLDKQHPSRRQDCHLEFRRAGFAKNADILNLIAGAIVLAIVLGGGAALASCCNQPFCFPFFVTSCLFAVVITAPLVCLPILSMSLSSLRAIRRVKISSSGISVITLTGRRDYRWSEFEVDPGKQRPDKLLLKAGKRKIVLTSELNGFDELKREIESHER